MAHQHKSDIVVVGAGPAGLAAAIAAHDAGASVTLLEASDVVGGTAAWSGGAAWAPMNRYELEAGAQDSRDAALAYMRACSDGTGDEALYAAYLDAAPEVIDYLDKETPLTFSAGTMPDYQAGLEGSLTTLGLSRSVAPDIFDLSTLGEDRALVRRSPHGTMPYNFREFEDLGLTIHPERLDLEEYGRRIEAGLVGWGEALAAGLYAGVRERHIPVHLNCRARRLLRADRIEGVLCDTQEGERLFEASKGVILACGGFEWDQQEMAAHFPAPITPATVPTNRGDGLSMAREAGAALGNLDALWGWPAYVVPGEVQPDGNPLVRTTLIERLLPHMICINGRGERFVDETISYHRILKEMTRRAADGSFPNLPAWHLFDAQFRARYAFGPVMPGMPDPAWLKAYPSLDALAEAIGVPGDALARTVAAYNDAVAAGRDDSIGRGGGGYAHFFGDRDNQPTPNMGTIAKAPFCAVEMIPATIGTCGGPKFDTHAQVIGQDGNLIEGLYAAGNVTAAFSGPSYFGPGGTLGPALIFGVIAGRSAARGGGA